MKPNPICITKQKLLFERERERERKREREIEKKGTDEIPYCISPLLYVALSVCASFICCLYVFVVCVFALFFCMCLLLFFLLSSSSFFFYLCVPLSIYREIPKKLFLVLPSTDQIMERFLSVISSTVPNFMFNRDPLFSLFLFSLFRCLLNSFLVCDSPLSPNRVPHFLVVIFLYSLLSFSIILLLLHLLLSVAIFNSLSLYFILIYLGTMVDLLFVNAMPTFPYFSHSFPIGNRGLAD